MEEEATHSPPISPMPILQAAYISYAYHLFGSRSHGRVGGAREGWGGRWRLEARGASSMEAGGNSRQLKTSYTTSRPPTQEARHEELEGGREGVGVGVRGACKGVPGYLEQRREKRGKRRKCREWCSGPGQEEAAQPSFRYPDTLLYPLGKSARWQLHKVQAELRCELACEMVVTCIVT